MIDQTKHQDTLNRMQKVELNKLNKDLGSALQLICDIDNQYPGNRDVQLLYDILFEAYKASTN